MDGVNATHHFGDELPTQEQSPSLLTIILDTNPAAWALLQPTLSISIAVANLLVFINAHLACNYTNQVAVIASHCDKAQWLYPTAAVQSPKQQTSQGQKNGLGDDEDEDEEPTSRSKRARLNGPSSTTNGESTSHSESESNKYRPFRLIEEELVRNLRTLMSSTSPKTIQEKTSTMIAGALTLALSYINRRSQEYQESLTGISTNLADQSAATASDPNGASSNALQSRILIITLSPSTDLAHQYIPIMNSIFACQRLNIPIDVLQLPLPQDPHTRSQGERPTRITNTSAVRHEPRNQSEHTDQSSQSGTVFLQQASDATHGVFIAAKLTPDASTHISNDVPISQIASHSLLTYLLTSLLPTPSSRLHLITPTRVDVDFRAACFCHRNVISIGFVCSICLSIFCEQSLQVLSEEGCITCGTKLSVRADGVGGWAGGKRPVVVAPKRKGKKKRRADGLSSEMGTPRHGTPA